MNTKCHSPKPVPSNDYRKAHDTYDTFYYLSKTHKEGIRLEEVSYVSYVTHERRVARPEERPTMTDRHTLTDRPYDHPVHTFHAGLIDNLYTITAHLRAELLDLQAQVIELQEAEMGRVHDSTMKARAARLIVEAATRAGYADE